MSRFNPYRDRFAGDGVISNGWRYVRKGGRVKIAGTWWHDPKLEQIIGEYVHVHIRDYWMSSVMVERGAVGCTDFYCNANAIDTN